MKFDVISELQRVNLNLNSKTNLKPIFLLANSVILPLDQTE